MDVINHDITPVDGHISIKYDKWIDFNNAKCITSKCLNDNAELPPCKCKSEMHH